jgi:hypothetical protein
MMPVITKEDIVKGGAIEELAQTPINTVAIQAEVTSPRMLTETNVRAQLLSEK